MNKKIASKLDSFIEEMEALVNESSDEVKNEQGVLNMLMTALADEWLASYQYWVCKNLVRGTGRVDTISEFDQHFKDEMEHADKLMLRIKELGGKPIFNPADWVNYANPWTEVNTESACAQLDITIKAEEDAIAYYEKMIKYCRGFDEITMRLCRSILSDEAEHLYDLQMLKEEICG